MTDKEVRYGCLQLAVTEHATTADILAAASAYVEFVLRGNDRLPAGVDVSATASGTPQPPISPWGDMFYGHGMGPEELHDEAS